MRVAIAQMNPIIGDFAGNSEKIVAFARRAEELGAELLILPELADSGMPLKGLADAPGFREAAARSFAALCCRAGDAPIVLAHVTGGDGGALEVALSVLRDGAEQRAMRVGQPGGTIATFVASAGDARLRVDASACPRSAGDSPRDWSRTLADLPAGVAACALHADLCSSRFVAGEDSGRWVLSARAKALGRTVARVCQVGGQSEYVFDGGSALVSPTGKMIARAVPYEEDLVIAATDAEGEAWPEPPPREEGVMKAIVLGIRDFVAKSGARKVVLGLSGGVDSAVVACLATTALGSQNVVGVSMPGAFTAPDGVRAVDELAGRLGIELLTVPIVPVLESFRSALAPIFRNVPEDVTEENLQARIRTCILMALCNKFGYLLLNSGNKSESSMGYCTLYGDTAGALGPILDLRKTEVYALAHAINRGKELIPRFIIDRPPTAELRAGQTDQEKLPPYEHLDRFLDLLLERGLTLADIRRSAMPGCDFGELYDAILSTAFKRRQSAPALRLSAHGVLGEGLLPLSHAFRADKPGEES